ncbi:MAG: glyceraldehyde-3-phosphate dehydrogenase [Bacteroidetes bacterium]|nr:glyceraldehyde-3-phosphate dehydrogenase [Bacteroidota bacterium]
MNSDILKTKKEAYDKELQSWIDKEKASARLINAVNKLIYDKSVELIFFRNTLIDISTSEVQKLHKYAKDIIEKNIDIYNTANIAEEILKIEDLYPSKIDIGRLSFEWANETNNKSDLGVFLKEKLKHCIGNNLSQIEPRDVVLYGFGRIGRLLARELIRISGKGQLLKLKAIVTRPGSGNDINKRASLMKMDSVHGEFKGSISVDAENQSLIINGQTIKMIEASKPDTIDYESYGISNAVLIDNTGVYRDRDSLSLHLKSKGIAKVMLTAPGKGDLPNIVYGVNHEQQDLVNENIFSAASCTTNAIVPVLKVVEDSFGIEKGHIETVHAYTNDQNLLDNMHKKSRRGRSAAINMVITETGAASAVSKVIPQLKNKLTANAVRVPIPNGSLAIMNLTIKKETSVDEINSTIKKAALEGPLVSQIKFSIDKELVSSDIIGNPCPAVFDSMATIVSPDQKNIVLYVWYDNEFGYTKQVIRLAKHVSCVRRFVYF